MDEVEPGSAADKARDPPGSGAKEQVAPRDGHGTAASLVHRAVERLKTGRVAFHPAREFRFNREMPPHDNLDRSDAHRHLPPLGLHRSGRNAHSEAGAVRLGLTSITERNLWFGDRRHEQQARGDRDSRYWQSSQ
jgi:hypothetical protein